MKTNGKTWNEYMDSWPADWWFDDSDERFNGKEPTGDPAPGDVVEFTCGVIYQSDDDHDGISLLQHFRRWLKSRDAVSLMVRVPKDTEEALRLFLKQNKGSVLA